MQKANGVARLPMPKPPPAREAAGREREMMPRPLLRSRIINLATPATATYSRYDAFSHRRVCFALVRGEGDFCV